MTVDEFMKKQKPDQVVALGAGSGFIFIGTPSEYEEKIDREYKKRQSYARELLNKSKNMLQACGRDGVPVIDVTIFEGRYDDPLSMVEASKEWIHEAAKIKNYARLLSSFADKVNRAAKAQIRAQELLNADGYRGREVIDTYPSIAEDKIIAIMAGDESGKYWDYAEVLREEDKKHGTEKDPGNNGAR